MTPEPAAAPPAKPAPCSPCDIFSWIAMGLGLVFVLHFHLLPALLAGLFVFSMVHRIALRLIVYKFLHSRSKMAAMLLLSMAMIAVSAGVALLLVGIVHGRVGGLPEMLEKMKLVVQSFKDWFTVRGIGEWIPDADKIYDLVVEYLEAHTEDLKKVGGDSVKMAIHALVGIVIGAMLSFRTAAPKGPLAISLAGRIARFAQAFEAVVFAQVKISALNTVFTSVYLLAVLPAFGVHLPMRGTMILVTFLCGMIPVVGNLISNAVIVLISLSASPGVAGASLAYLIIIHKLEYFMNAKIVGGHIDAAAWEILLAMLCMETAFGIQGVILAPIAYAYLKSELKARALV